MFDKFKARIAKLEETNENFRKISHHLKDNKKVYIAGAGCLGFGFVGGKYLQRPIVIDFQPVINNMPVFNNHNIGNVVENTINNIGRLHKLVKRINPDGTEQLYETIGDAALDFSKESGLKLASARQLISDCVNGRKPSVHDLKFVSVGTGTR